MLSKIKQRFIDKFWKVVYVVDDDLKCIEQESATPFKDIVDNIYDPATALHFHKNNGQILTGTFHVLNRDCVIEPSMLSAIVGLNKIVAYSIFSHETKPATINYLKYRFLKTGQEKVIEEGILFDGNLSVNYFHFFADVFNKLWVLERHNFDKSIPLIIGRKIFEKRYFKYLYENTEIKKWNWLVQEETDFIKCKRLYLINPSPYYKPFWDKTVSLVKDLKSNEKPFRRLFLSRPVSLKRTLTNFESLFPVLKEHGFEIVDPGSMSFEQQVKLFSEAEIIAGMHGAAFTNMIFAQAATLRILEISPCDRTSGQLYWLAAMIKVKYYDCILGSSLEEGNFEVSTEIFEKAILRLIKN